MDAFEKCLDILDKQTKKRPLKENETITINLTTGRVIRRTHKHPIKDDYALDTPNDYYCILCKHRHWRGTKVFMRHIKMCRKDMRFRDKGWLVRDGVIPDKNGVLKRRM